MDGWQWPGVWSFASTCAQKKAKQRLNIDRTHKLHRQQRNMHDIPPDEAEEFDAIFQNARKMLEILVEPAMPRATQIRISTGEVPTRKVAVSIEGGERHPPALSEGRLSLKKCEREIEAFEPQMCILHRGRTHSHVGHVAD